MGLPAIFGMKKAKRLGALDRWVVQRGDQMKKLSAMGRRQVKERVLTNLRRQAKAAEQPDSKQSKAPRVVTLYF